MMFLFFSSILEVDDCVLLTIYPA